LHLVAVEVAHVLVIVGTIAAPVVTQTLTAGVVASTAGAVHIRLTPVPPYLLAAIAEPPGIAAAGNPAVSVNGVLDTMYLSHG
jgi:hypothetical protein